MDHAVRQIVMAALVAFVWLGVAAPGAAQSSYPSLAGPSNVEQTGEGDVAVIVAIQDYVFLPEIPGAIVNANDWETHFRRGLGMEDVRVLTDRQGARENILDFARRAAEDVEEGGRLWFVFIGHGAPAGDGGDGVLVGMDARASAESLESRGVTQETLLQELESGRHSETVVVLDACFSGRARGGEALVEGAQPVVPVSEPEVGSRTTVLSAAKNDEVAGALPGADRPAFSYLLLGALRGWADDGDGTVTAEEALTWTRKQLRLVPGRQQTPGVFGRKELAIVRGVSEADPGIAEMVAGATRRSTDRSEAGGGSERDAPEEISKDDLPACPDGMVRNDDTLGNCCWPGQSWNGRRCVGEPTACPDHHVVEDNSCVLPACEQGRVRTPDGVHCCWPEQGWSSTKGKCVGAPNCPDDTIPKNDTCLPDGDGDEISGADDECPQEPEDEDGVADGDGCPEDDADADGFADSEDQCPEKAEDEDGFEDGDGCPEARDGSAKIAYWETVIGGGGFVVGAGLFTAGTIMRSSLRSDLEAAEQSGIVGHKEITQSEALARSRASVAMRTIGTITGVTGGLVLIAGIANGVADPDPMFGQLDVRLQIAPDGRRARFSLKVPF